MMFKLIHDEQKNFYLRPIFTQIKPEIILG